jgi:hypothetical protein
MIGWAAFRGGLNGEPMLFPGWSLHTDGCFFLSSACGVESWLFQSSLWDYSTNGPLILAGHFTEK